MRTETITKEIFLFDELSDEAKQKARDWWNHDLCKSEKEDVAQEVYKRSWQSLIGREIEKLWELYNRSLG